MILRHSIAAALVGALAGCDAAGLSSPSGELGLTGEKWDVAKVAELPTSEDPYRQGLQEGYLELAKAELSEFDWIDGAEFTSRARAAAEGQEPPPMDPAERVDEGPQSEPLAAAFVELSGFIASKGARLRAGRQIGDAQVAFDCWVQESEEGHQSADIDACRGQYEQLILLVRDLGALPANMAVVLPQEDGAIGGIELGRSGETVALDQPFAAAGTGKRFGDVPVEEGEIREAFSGALSAQPEPPAEFTLTFDFGSTRVGTEAFDLIAQAAEEALRRPAAEVIVTGHADAPGTSAANLVLSRQRADRVRREVLRELGAQEGKVDVSVRTGARGERDLIVPDSRPEERNRRVVILVR